MSRLLHTLLESGRATSRIAPLQAILAAIKAHLEHAESEKSGINISNIIQLLVIALRCAPVKITAKDEIAEVGEMFRDCLICVAKLALVSEQIMSLRLVKI